MFTVKTALGNNTSNASKSPSDDETILVPIPYSAFPFPTEVQITDTKSTKELAQASESEDTFATSETYVGEDPTESNLSLIHI